MEVGVGPIAMLDVCLRHVIVEHHIDALNVDSSPYQISGDQQSLHTPLECAAVYHKCC